MDQSEKQGRLQKKLRKSSSNLISRRGTGVSASLGMAIPVDGSGSASASTGAPAGSLGIGGGTSPHPGPSLWPATSLGGSFMIDASPSSSEWLYPKGGFVNSLQNALQMPQTSHMFPHTYSASYPNASNLPENLHFIGASSRGTPSPNASGLAMGAADAQNGSQEETIDIDDDDTLEPTRFILCT